MARPDACTASFTVTFSIPAPKRAGKSKIIAAIMVALENILEANHDQLWILVHHYHSQLAILALQSRANLVPHD